MDWIIAVVAFTIGGIAVVVMTNHFIWTAIRRIARMLESAGRTLTSVTKASVHLSTRVAELEKGAAEAAKVIEEHRSQIASLLVSIESLRPPF